MHLVDPFAILASYKPRSQANLKSCQGMNLFKMLDERTKHPVYQENMQAANTRVGNTKYKYKYKYKGGLDTETNIFVRILFLTCCVIRCASAFLVKGQQPVAQSNGVAGKGKVAASPHIECATFPLSWKALNQIKKMKLNLNQCLGSGRPKKRLINQN